MRLAILLCIVMCAGCGLRKQARPVTVLKTEDFVADPTTTPTQAEASEVESAAETQAEPFAAAPPRQSRPPTIMSPAAATDGAFNVSAVVGPPTVEGTAASPAARSVLVDAKVGEINGRPVRAEALLEPMADRLATAASDRRFSVEEWTLVSYPNPPSAERMRQPVRREDWLILCERLFGIALNRELEDQLLAEEARSSLRPEQQQGLKYLVEQATEDFRRGAQGSRAAAERILGGRSTREFERDAESRMLVQYELQERLRSRVSTSWRDVRLFYERNSDIYNPPPVAKFRLIRVPASKPEDIAAIQQALDEGLPFATVAAMPQNQYNRRDGGRFLPDQKFTGEYDKATFFTGTLTEAARTLAPGKFTPQPVEFGRDKAWLFLEDIERTSRPLSDTDVQLSIAERLNASAMNAEKTAYIERLKERATFTDLDLMIGRLVAIAAERYWPAER
jgi:hypothetical protein